MMGWFMRSRRLIEAFLVFLVIFAFAIRQAPADDSNAVPAQPPSPSGNSDSWTPLHDKALSAFNSRNASEIADAIADLRKTGIEKRPFRDRVVGLLIQVKRYDDAEQMAVDLILCDPGSTAFVANAEKMRAKAFLAQGRGSEALSAARSYYDLATLKDSSDAVNVIALCLAMDKPDDPTIAKRFKAQQIAWAAADPASQPSNFLGDPILPTIPPDSKPFEGAADKIQLDDYQKFLAMGNLLLLTGKAKEALGIFERAQGIAPDARQAEAVENVARATRAEAGCIAPANAYILQMRNESQQ
jgi:tetratricopeptide (TPR) repeat protein